LASSNGVSGISAFGTISNATVKSREARGLRRENRYCCDEASHIVHATLRPAGALVKVNEFACSIGGELEWLSKIPITLKSPLWATGLNERKRLFTSTTVYPRKT